MGSKSTKEDLIRQLEKLNLPTDGKVEELKQRLKEHKNKPKRSQMSIVPEVETQEGRPAQKTVSHFIHLKTSNFIYYLNSAVIVPVALIENETYRTENRRPDILTKFPGHIIVSTKPVDTFASDDVMVEIDSSAVELVMVSEDVYYTSSPIPISKIISVIFPSQETKKRFLADIKIYPDSFFPEELCNVSVGSDATVRMDASVVKLPDNEQLRYWSEKLLVFDRILGMFSFMRNVGIIYATQEGVYQQYTDAFFYALYSIYQVEPQSFERDQPVFKYLLRLKGSEGQNVQRALFERVVARIYAGQPFNCTEAATLLSELAAAGLFSREEEKTMATAADIFKKLSRQEIIFKELLGSDLFRRNYALFGLLFLAQFGNAQKSHMDKQAVRNVFIGSTALMGRNTAEYLLALLGLYYGYKNMVKADTNLVPDDRIFATLAAEEQTIKVKDLHYIDRIMVESCFEYARTDNPLKRKFEVAKYPNPKVQRSPLSIAANGDLYTDHSYKKFDTWVTVLERRNKLQQLAEIIVKEFPALITGNSLTLQFLINKYGIPKRWLVELLLEYGNSSEAADLKMLIGIDTSQLNKK